MPRSEVPRPAKITFAEMRERGVRRGSGSVAAMTGRQALVLIIGELNQRTFARALTPLSLLTYRQNASCLTRGKPGAFRKWPVTQLALRFIAFKFTKSIFGRHIADELVFQPNSPLLQNRIW
jgi:hypothetical protein